MDGPAVPGFTIGGSHAKVVNMQTRAFVDVPTGVVSLERLTQELPSEVDDRTGVVRISDAVLKNVLVATAGDEQVIFDSSCTFERAKVMISTPGGVTVSTFMGEEESRGEDDPWDDEYPFL